jgi:hypothetical protein
MAKIVGIDGFQRLMLGRETNINQIKTKPFRVSEKATNGVLPGDLLIRTDTTQVYTTPSFTGLSSEYSGKVAGIALSTNVKTDVLFPQSEDEVKFTSGEAGSCVIYGEVAVSLYGVSPSEGDDVYYLPSQRSFCTSVTGSTSGFKIEGWKFSGITEGNLTVVYVK